MLTASSINGSFNSGALSNDAGGHASTGYGTFALAQTGTSVTLLWTPLTPFQAWQFTNFGANWLNPAIAGPSADPDGDGLPNLLEYALGDSPVARNKSGITCAMSGTSLTMTYTRLKSATDITVQPQWSANLVAWSSTGVALQVVSDNGTVQSINALVATGTNKKLFMRMEVTQP